MWEMETLGLAGVERELLTLEAGLDDPAAFLAGDAAVIAGESIRGNFEAGGRPARWPDITAKSRRQRRFNMTSGPLIDSGALRDAASATDSSVEGSVFSVDGDTLTLGTDLVYAGVQNYGWEEKNIPAREYMILQIEDEIRLKVALEDDYLHRMLANWE